MKRRRRTRPLLRVLVRVPGCLALTAGLLFAGAGAGSAEQGRPNPLSALPAPFPPDGEDTGAVQLDGQVTPVDTEVAAAENGDFTLRVANAGTVAAEDVRVLLDAATAGNGVGSADGRCLSRLDAASPADLWCELGDLEPGQSVRVQVHAFMNQCVWFDPDGSAQRAPAFRWSVIYSDAGRTVVRTGPTPRWSCAG